MNKIFGKKTAKKFILLLPVAVFILLALYNITYPGMSIDEAGDGIVSGYILRDIRGLNLPLMVTNFHVQPFNRVMPVMCGEYVGPLFAYLICPFTFLFGPNILALRLASVCFSALTIVFMYLSCAAIFNRRMAFLAAVLTATSVLFVHYARVGLYREEMFLLFFFWSALFSFIRYEQSGNNLFLYLAAFILGAGLNAKITFLWYLIGLAAAWAVIGRKTPPMKGIRVKQVLLALAAFFSGLFFLILYNLENHWVTIRVMLESLMKTPYRMPQLGINNMAYADNLRMRVEHFFMLLRGAFGGGAPRGDDRNDWGARCVSSVESLAPVVVALALIALAGAVILVLWKNKRERRGALFLYILYLTVLTLSPFTLSGYSAGHLAILLPFPQIAMAIFLDSAVSGLKRSRLARALMYSVFLVPVLLFNVGLSLHISNEMKRTGGYRRWSTAIYEVADFLQRRNIAAPIVFGWGLKENIAYISGYKVIPLLLEDGKYSDLHKSIEEEYGSLTRASIPLYYLTMEYDENVKLRDRFLSFAEADGRHLILEKVFYNNAGDQVYWLYKII